MSANTLASALAAARKASLPPAVQAQSIGAGLRPGAATRSAATVFPAAAAVPVVAVQAAVVAAPVVAAAARTELSNADALIIAIQRSARTVDDIMTRRMLLASGCWGAAQGIGNR